MPSISVSQLSFTFTSAPLLENLSFRISESERAVFVGPNGCGKSTLLNILNGALEPHRGKMEIVPGGAVKLQVQGVPEAGTVREYLDRELYPVASLMERFEKVSTRLSDADPAVEAEYNELLVAMTAADVWNLESRLQETLAALGLGRLDIDQRDVSTLSPGQRGRLQLAALLILRPPLLILDEPTNHLDYHAISFLVDLLNKWDGPVLMASHDRAFIESVATVIYDLDLSSWRALETARGGNEVSGVYRCQGNYSHYLQAKETARASHVAIHAAQQSQKRNLKEHRTASQAIARGGVRLKSAEGSAKKFFADRATATAKRRMSNDDRKLESLSQREVRKPRFYELSLDLQDPPDETGIAVSAREASVSGRLAPLTFDLAYGEHLLVTGANGAGKSTLLSWIAEGRPPVGALSHGDIDRDPNLHVIPQRLPSLGDVGVTDEIWNQGIGELGTGILHPSMWSTPVYQLSAGNQRRAQLAIATAQAPSVLVIDEPTNYLDLATIEVLETALQDWTGALLIASHDRWLIENWHGRHIELER